MNDNYFKFSLSVIVLPFLFLLAIWTVFWIEIRFHIELSHFGIYPRTLEGLRGVVFSPFLHGDIQHIYNNSIPVFLMMMALRYFYREHFFKIIGYGILFSGLVTWVIARNSYHIGASGLIYVLVSFIFVKGIMTQYYRLVALSLIIVLLYGGLIWYIFPDVQEGISWEGHLSGLITGFVFAVAIKTPDYKKQIRYDWERPDFDPSGDKFLERFDENGNFVNPPKPEIIEEKSLLTHTFQPSVKIVYRFIENSTENSKTEK